jgi:hypothetical protein
VIAKRSLALAACFLVACTEAHTRRFDAAAVIPVQKSYEVTAGSSQVLEIYRVSGIPIPDAFSGYGFYLQVEPSLIHEGATIDVPSDRAKPFLWLLKAPQYRSSTNVAGVVRISSIRETELRATVDLRSTDLPWKYSGEVTFVSAIVPPRRQ